MEEEEGNQLVIDEHSPFPLAGAIGKSVRAQDEGPDDEVNTYQRS